MLNKILLTICLFALSTQFIHSQTLSVPINENFIKGRVKQMDEFFARFNMEETWDGHKITNKSDKDYRRKYLATLFDESQFRKNNGSMDNLASSFISEVVDNNYMLNYEDSTWTAEVLCTALIGSLRHNIRLFLHTQKICKGEYKWVIFNVSGKPFDLNTQDSKAPIISPMEHEIGFIGLTTISNKALCSVSAFDNVSFTADRLSMFAALLNNNLLKIETIDNVSFHFFTIPGFSFKVERVERRGSYNTGWLITKLNKYSNKSDMTKKTYLIIYLLLFCFIPMNMMAQKQIKLTANDKERIVKKVKKYCDMLITFSSDIENVDKMEQITELCENDKVQTFDDLSDLTKKNNGEYHSIPLFQYLQNITTKYENSIQMSFTDIKCERTVSEPAINKDIDGNAYAIVHVVKTMKSKGLNIKLPLKITVNLRTMKIGGTVSETYEDPQMLYLKGLEARNNNDFKKAIEYFEKCFSYKSFANRYRAMTMLGFVYSTMRDWEKCINSLEIASEHDPVGGIFLANIYMGRGFVIPAKYYKPLKALTILEKYSENRDKDFPDVQAMAYLMLGLIYAQGEIVPQNLAKGLEYMTKAHTCSLEANNLFYCYLSDYLSIGFMTMGNQNMTEALDRLCVLESQLTTFLADQTDETKQTSKFQVYLTIGLLYAEKQDKTNALEYVKKLLALEMPETYYSIAEIYKKIKLYDTAFLYYKLAAENNDVQAAYFMELYYMPDPEIDDEADEFYKYLCTNRGDKDNQLCLYWMQKGAELGNSQCMAHLIYFYLNKPQVVPYNLKEATYWTCKYLDVLPYYSDGPYTFGKHIPYRIYKEKDKEALAELNKMANAGSHSAELMKFIYYYYVDEEHKDTIAAIEALTQSAEQGYFPALNQMAIITIEQKDSINSLYWINKMIEQNNPTGYLHLANYEQDIKKDKKKSFECLLKAYDMKCPTGAYFIGDAYRIGDYGAEINLDKAKFYFNKTLEFMPDYSGTIYDIYADSARIYLKQIDEIILAETPYTSTAETYINNLEQLTNTSKTLECRIEEIENVSKLFASDEAVIKIVGNNGTTIVSTETSNDFLLRLATTSRKIKLKEVSCKKDNKGKITELILQEMVI